MKKLFYTLFLIPLFSMDCSKQNEDCHSTIFFENNSNIPVYVKDSFDYPDTTNYYIHVATSSDKTLPGETNSFSLSLLNNCYEAAFFKEPSDTLMIFLYDANIVESTPWDSIKKHQMYLKRYDLSLEDIKKLNWKVTYP